MVCEAQSISFITVTITIILTMKVTSDIKSIKKVFTTILTMKVCEALLDGGADPAAQSGEECTVLHYLVQVRLDD